MDKTIRVELGVWRRAKVCAAEADISLKAFLEEALRSACYTHERRKRAEVRVAPVEFVEGKA